MKSANRNASGPTSAVRRYNRIAVALLALPMIAFGQDDVSVVFRDPTFEQLAAAIVTSVARREQSYFSTSAAVYIVSAEEIRRSGARNLPEALRLAPGVEVARLNTHRYAVAIRGFNSEFTTKLLVLQDGRHLYTPLFAGTFWDMQDTLLDDVDRVEVVRGPGGTAWGANAVNGVINIVTKSAAETQGWLGTLGVGTEERGYGNLRYGGRFGDDNTYRIYLSGNSRDETVFANGMSADDASRQIRGGFRVDSALSSRDSLTIHGETYDGRADQLALGVASVIDVDGTYLMSQWQHSFADQDRLSVQFYFDTSHRQSGQGIADKEDWSLELVQHTQWGGRHDFTYGLHYRRSENSFDTVPGLVFDPPVRALKYAGAFVDDAVGFFDKQLTVSAGLKVERNDFTGTEWLPNVRVLWQPREHYALWAAVSRGVRIPSISDNDQTASFPGFLNLPNSELPAETLTAYELGWRMRDADLWTLDVAIFRNHYTTLRTRESEIIGPPTTLVVMRGDNMRGSTYGVESVAAVHLSNAWRVQANVGYIDFDLRIDPGSTDATSIVDAAASPRWQAGLRSSLRLGQWDIYAQYRYVDALSALRVPSYHSLDVNVSWQATRNFELSLIGQNLINAKHAEFRNSPVQPPSSEIERGAYLRLRWMH